MTLQETGIIMDILTTAYPRFYSGRDAPDQGQTLRLWAEMFAEDDVAFVAAAVKSYIAMDQKGFPPHIGAIKNAMLALRQSREPDEDRAVEMLRRAAANSAYGAEEEFARLPESLRRMAGSPAQLYEWSQMDSDIFNSVVLSHLRRSFLLRRESSRRDALLPGEVKRVLAGLRGPAAPALGAPE